MYFLIFGKNEHCVNTGTDHMPCLNHFRHFIQNMNKTTTKHVQRQQFIFKTASRVTELFFRKPYFLCVCLFKLFVFLAGLT